MEIVTDLHLHSKYSRAVSPQMTLLEMAKWAGIKGIDLLGTGDFTHPLWLTEIKEKLDEEAGILKLKDKGNQKEKKDKRETKFLLTTEVSSIYSQGGKTRKIHNLIVAPSVSVVEKINAELKKRGCNLSSDGRPIVGLSAKNVAEIVLTADDDCLIIPAHIWTPWFSMFGANSGFDSIEECFGEFSKYIYAVETGLSSDPEMNWRIADLAKRSIVSFSDAHSGSKLGREATVFASSENGISNFSYENIRDALMGKPGKMKISHTIEFYPEEGKYHWTGHRNCKVIFSPEDTSKKGLTCPVCGKRLTPGVMERVCELGARVSNRVRGENDEMGLRWIRGEKEGQERTPFIKLVPLKEIISESLGVGESSKKVEEVYFKLIDNFGNEIEILTKKKIGPAFAEAMAGKGERLAEGILKVRKGDIFIRPGYDGEFGVVRIWPNLAKTTEDGQEKQGKEQMGLFS